MDGAPRQASFHSKCPRPQGAAHDQKAGRVIVRLFVAPRAGHSADAAPSGTKSGRGRIKLKKKGWAKPPWLDADGGMPDNGPTTGRIGPTISTAGEGAQNAVSGCKIHGMDAAGPKSAGRKSVKLELTKYFIELLKANPAGISPPWKSLGGFLRIFPRNARKKGQQQERSPQNGRGFARSA